MTQIWTLLRGWADTRPGGMNDSQIARALDVQTQRVSKWKRGAIPDPASVRKIAEVTGIPHHQLVQAVIIDQGYADDDVATAAYPPAVSVGHTRRDQQDAEAEAPDAPGPDHGA